MNILRSYKRTRLFLWVNITGLAIGLATCIMLILFVINELSYDKHFANNERIVNLLSVIEENGNTSYYGINLRRAYSELPGKIPGIEAAVQIYDAGKVEVINKPEHFQNLRLLFTDPEFFSVFQLKFIEGTPQTALADMNSIVLTREKAEAIFGNTGDAIGKKLIVEEHELNVAGVVEQLPSNTHFSFDILARMAPSFEEYGGLEFITYYLIKPDASVADVSASIEKEYTAIMEPFAAYFNGKGYGYTQKLTDIYLHSKADRQLWKSNSMSFIWLLSGLALFILLLAVTNFINMFMAQGETRMNEIGIRKANGARIQDIVRQFFTEVSTIVFIAFVLAFVLAVIATPYFSELINKDIELSQLMSPLFIMYIVVLFVITVILSAFYPSFYLSRFNPLDILGKRIRLSKRRLNTIVVVFQSIITIILISFILVINRQTTFLENIPLGYNPENVVSAIPTKSVRSGYTALKQELLSFPEVKMVSSSHHTIGSGPSGQLIGLLDDREKNFSINEYRIMPELCELMEFKLREGEFYKETAPDSLRQVVLNEAAIKMLGLSYPVVGKQVNYNGPSEIIGVVKDFYYGEPAYTIQPIILSRTNRVGLIYIKFDTNVSQSKAQEIIVTAFRKFDPDFYPNTIWSKEIYTQKFESIKTQSKIMMIGSFLSIFIAMLGLVAMHLYTTMRRTKEIGIRRVNGASPENIFILLSRDIIKWIVVAGIIAIPIVYYVASEWLNNYTNRASLDWIIFILPVLVQCATAFAVTSGVSMRVLSKNPVEALKTE